MLVPEVWVSPGTGVPGGCKPCGCWEWNLGSLQEHYTLLTAEPSLQPVCEVSSLGGQFRLTLDVRTLGLFLELCVKGFMDILNWGSPALCKSDILNII